MNLTTLITEQKRELYEHLKHTYQTAFGGLDGAMEKTDALNTTATTKLLEAIIGEMEKDIFEYQGADDYHTGYNSALETQINNLTAVIESLK